MEHTVQLENESGENPALKTAVIGVLIAFMYYVSSVYIYTNMKLKQKWYARKDYSKGHITED